MKNLNTAMTEIVSGNSTRYYSKYVVAGKEHTETLNNFKYQNIINPNNEITIGNTCASSVTFSIYMPTVSLENKEITVFEGVKVNEEIQYIQLGIFTITKQTSDGEYTSYEAYDRMYKADMPYFSDMAFPSTDKAILNEICGKLGISLATNIATAHTISDKPQGYTYREIIGYMAMLQGCNAVINSDGNLELRWYKDSGYVLNGHKYYQQGVTFTTSKDFIIEKLTCNNTKSGDKETSTITSGSGATGLSFANPFMTQAILDKVYKKIGGFQFRPLTVKFVGDYRLEVGDIITVNKGGVDYKVPIMQITHECDGGLIDTVASIGQSDTENSNIASGPITKQMERYYADLITVNKALINKLDVDTAKLKYAQIDFANVKGQVVTTSLIKDGAVTNEKVQSLSANKLTAGTIDAGKIRVTNLNADNITAGTINGKRIGNGSINLDKLSEEVPTKEYLDKVQDELQGQIDGNIETFTKTEIPTLNNDPAVNWTDNVTRKKHIGDICYVVNPASSADGYSYRFADTGTLEAPNYEWVLIKDSDVTKALQDIININGEITGIKNFNVEVSSWKTDTSEELSSLKKRTTTIETDYSTKQDVTDKINGIQVGGTNMLLWTTTMPGKFSTDSSGASSKGTVSYQSDGSALVTNNNSNFRFQYHPDVSVMIGSTYVVSAYYKDVSGTQEHQFQIVYQSTTGKYTDFHGVTGTREVENGWKQSYLVFTIPNTIKTTRLITVYLRSGADYTLYNHSYYIKNVKLELGNKVTTWSPAPEDVVDAINTKVSTTVFNEVKQTVDENSANITKMTETIKTKADGSTVTTLTNTVNSVKQTADSNSSSISTLSTTVSKLSNTVSNQGSSITQLQGSITNKVWKTDITESVNNLQVGGRNLLKGTHKTEVTYTYPTSSWVDKGNWVTTVPLDADYYTLSFWAKSTKAGDRIRIHFYNPSNSVLQQASQGQTHVSGDGTCDFVLSTTLTHYWVTYRLQTKNSTRNVAIPRLFAGWGSGTLTFKWEKVEEGTKATSWSPAPEDVDSSISAVNNKVTTVSNQYTTLNQTVNSISATVNSHTSQIATKADNSTVTTINNKVTSLTTDLSGFKTTVSDTYATKSSLSNYATTTAMNSAIKQSASSITTTVSATYATKSSLSSYATTASLSAYIAKTDTGTLKSCIEAIADTINITARGGLNLSGNRFTLSSTNTSITASGVLTCNNLIANGGKIAQWNIANNSINSTTPDSKYWVGMTTPPKGTDWVFATLTNEGSSISENWKEKWYVRADGLMYASNAIISGTGYLTSGKIGDWNIKGYLQADTLANDGYLRRVWISPYQQNSGDSTWIYSIQKGIQAGNNPQKLSPLWTVYGNGNMLTQDLSVYGNLFAIKGLNVGSDGNPQIANFYCNNPNSDTQVATNVRIYNNDTSKNFYSQTEVSLMGSMIAKYSITAMGGFIGTIASDSDRNVKKDIKALEIERTADFIYSLIPSEFRMKDGTSNRLHHGFIAQEVKEKMGDSDWGLFIDKKVNDDNYEIQVSDEDGNTTKELTARYALRYDELIADLVATVQSQNMRIKKLEKQLSN